VQQQTRKIFIMVAGREVVIEDESQIRVETTVTEICDNKKCQGPDGKSGPTSLTWVMEKTKTDPYATPERLWGFVRRHRLGDNEPQSYCSELCEKEGKRDLTPIISPHEQRRIQAACAAVEAQQNEQPEPPMTRPQEGL
jgi:hypothetical protein